MKLKCPYCGVGRMKLLSEGQVQHEKKQEWRMDVICQTCHAQLVGRGKSRADCVAKYRRHCEKVREKKDGQRK